MPRAVAERRTRTRGIGWQRYSCGSVAVRLPVAPRALVVAAAIPLLFLHARYQPGFSVGSVDAYLSDFAVLAVVLTALSVGLRDGFAPLAAGRWIWLALGCFLLWMIVGVAIGHRHSPAYAAHTHAVTAAKFAE